MTGLTLGADEFLNKPVDLRELLLRIHRVAGRSAAVAGSRAPADLLGYPAFVAAARGPISAGPATIALVRVPAGPLQAAAVERSASRCAAGTLSAATTPPTWCSCSPA